VHPDPPKKKKNKISITVLLKESILKKSKEKLLKFIYKEPKNPTV
jgi:hypothetical protein